MENKPSFEYSYSAPQQEEVRKIREKYLPQQEQLSKLERLRALDQSVTRPGTVVSLILGILGTLIFGAGMSCTMVLTDYFVLGIVLGVVGMTVLGSAYPAYHAITKKQRQKLAPQILALADELEQK